MTTILAIGFLLNIFSISAHITWADKDPTHEDIVVVAMLVLSFAPYLNFLLVSGELFCQKVFHIHHGNKYKKNECPYCN